METKIYSNKGKEVKTIKLPESVFGLKWNSDLVHQVITSMTSSSRMNTTHTKTRGEVRGGGKKPWKQKGTGQARHGSTRSPIWVGGGVAHGPRNDKNYDRKVNKKMKIKALFTILSKKFKDSEILFVDSLSIAKPQTKEAIKMIDSLAAIKGFEKLNTKPKNVAFIGLDAKNANTELSFRNINSVFSSELRNLSPVNAMNYKYIIIENPENSLSAFTNKLNK